MAPQLSVIVPTLNAGAEIDNLLSLLESQTLPAKEIIVVDSASDDTTCEFVQKHPATKLIQISRKDFNHGTTRDMALKASTGDFVCFLTQDAVPASADYLKNLVAPMLSDEAIALVSGRQLPKADARRMEQLVREFNYPDTPSVKSRADLNTYGIKTFFASDVCSCYRRTAYLACGGFPALETNEDMLMAARFIAAGYKVAYEPSAAVFHSHNLTPAEQYKRNKLVGRFLATHSDELMNASEIGDGGKLVKSVASQLLREGRVGEFFAFGVDCCARLAGNRAGRASISRFEKEAEGSASEATCNER